MIIKTKNAASTIFFNKNVILFLIYIIFYLIVVIFQQAADLQFSSVKIFLKWNFIYFGVKFSPFPVAPKSATVNAQFPSHSIQNIVGFIQLNNKVIISCVF
jgi:hypothetical protein